MDPPEKIKKCSLMNKKEFNGTEFRKLLNGDYALEALKEFTTLCKKENEKDVVAEYLKAKGSVFEIIQLLDGSNKKNTNASVVLTAMHLVMKKIIEQFPDQLQLMEQACNNLINNHMSTIHFMLSTESKAKDRKVILKLLTIMVTYGGQFPHKLLNHLSLHLELVEFLVAHVNPVDSDNVRTCFINLILAFLTEGDTTVVRTLLEKRGVVSSIFSDLVYDYPNFVEHVLAVVKKRVLENPAISKTMKLHVFSTNVIQGIVNLYNWKGPKNWSDNKKENSTVKVDVDPEQKKIAVNAVHEFLTTLLTSNKYGVVFNDRKLGLDSSRKHNQIINTVLEKIDKPWEHEKPSELIIKILTACPDLIKSQLSLVESLLVPRVSKTWFSLIEFLRKIIENINEINCLKLCSVEMSVIQLTNAITNLTLPQIILQSAVIPSLEQNNPLIHNGIIKLVLAMIRKIESFILALDNIQQNSDSTHLLKSNLLVHLSKNIPSFEKILTIWEQAFSTIEENSDIDKIGTNIISVKDRLSALLDLLQAYSEVCPEVLLINADNVSHNPKVLLLSLDKVPDVNEEELTIMKAKALKILLRSNLISFAPNEEIFTFALSFLITKYVHENNLYDLEIKQTLKLLLNNCEVFEGYDDQIEIWINAITSIKSHEDKLKVAEWLTKIIKRVFNNTQKYEALIIQAEKIVEEDLLSVNKVDDIFDELSERTIECTKLTPMLPTTSVSILIYCALENVKKGTSDSVSCYVSNILVHTLHCQINPKTLLNLVGDLKITAQKYLSSWSEDKTPCPIKESLGLNKVFHATSKLLLKSDSDVKVEVKNSNLCLSMNGNEKIFTINDFDVVALMRMVVFYLTQILQKINVDLNDISKFEGVLLSLLKIASELKIDSHDLIENCLKCFFKHPMILHYFHGIHKNKNSADYMITKLFIKICKENQSFLQQYLLEPYQEKFLNKIKSSFNKKQNSKTEIKILLDLVKILQLDAKSIVDLLNIIACANKDKFVVTNEKSSLSIWGILVPELINELTLQEVKNNSVSIEAMPNDLLKKLLRHMLEIKNLCNQDVSSWEDSFYKYLLKFSHNISAIDTKTFSDLVKSNVTSSSERLISLICQKNFDFFKAFIKYLSSNEKILNHQSLVFSVLSSNSNYKLNSNLLDKILESSNTYILHYLGISKEDDVSWIRENVDDMAFFIENHLTIEKCCFYSSQILSTINELNDVDENRVKLYYSVFKKCSKADSKALKNFSKILFHTIVATLKKDSKNIEKLNYLCKIMIDTLDSLKLQEPDFIFEEISKNYEWPLFVRTSLKTGFKSGKENEEIQFNLLIKTLSKICEMSYKSNDCEEYVKKIFEMLKNHTKFEEVMTGNSYLKDHLVELLWILIGKNKNIMSTEDIPIYMCAYNATLSKSDQTIFKILRHYESNDIKFSQYSPFLWGKTAKAHYNVEFSLDTALYRDRSVSQFLDLLEYEKILTTVKNFPLTRNSKGDYIDVENADQIYDPAFYMPILCSLLKDSNDVPCHKVISKGAFSLALVTCCSNCSELRLLAFNILSRFYSHLKILGAHSYGTKEKLFWINFIEVLKNGIQKHEQEEIKKVRLNGFVATFLARAALVMVQPLDPLFTRLHDFFVLKPALELNCIPEFLPLFHSSEVEHLTHRHWILEVIRDGFKNKEDMNIASNYFVFKVLLSFYNCKLSDAVTDNLILQIVRSSTKLSDRCLILIDKYSLLPWLITASASIKKGDVDSIDCTIDIVSNIFQAIPNTKSWETHRILLIKVLFCTKSHFINNQNIDCFQKFVNISKNIIATISNSNVFTKEYVEQLYKFES